MALTNYQRETLNFALSNERTLALQKKNLEHLDTILTNAAISLEYATDRTREYWTAFVKEMTELHHDLEYQLRLERQVPTRDMDPNTASAQKYVGEVLDLVNAWGKRDLAEITAEITKMEATADHGPVAARSASEKAAQMLKTVKLQRHLADQGAWSGEDDRRTGCTINLAIEEAERMLSA